MIDHHMARKTCRIRIRLKSLKRKGFGGFFILKTKEEEEQ